MSIFCGDSANLLSAEIVSTQPSDLNAEIKIDNHSAMIKPLLLNSGDSIRVKLVGTNFAQSIKLRGRIVGIPKFVEKDTSIVTVSTLLDALKLAVELAARGFI